LPWLTSSPGSPGASWPTAAISRSALWRESPSTDSTSNTCLPAEVCESVRRDGGSVFPALTESDGAYGPLRPFRFSNRPFGFKH
jgi:hypothetical protein